MCSHKSTHPAVRPIIATAPRKHRVDHRAAQRTWIAHRGSADHHRRTACAPRWPQCPPPVRPSKFGRPPARSPPGAPRNGVPVGLAAEPLGPGAAETQWPPPASSRMRATSTWCGIVVPTPGESWPSPAQAPPPPRRRHRSEQRRPRSIAAPRPPLTTPPAAAQVQVDQVRPERHHRPRPPVTSPRGCPTTAPPPPFGHVERIRSRLWSARRVTASAKISGT